MPKVLKYFDFNGLAESIRYILHYTNQEFEDVRYDHTSWPIKEVKDAVPFGQLPVLEEGNKALNQSIAIARYVAAGTELLPSDPWEQATLDATVLTIYDFHKHVADIIHADDPEEKEKLKKKFYDETLDYYFSRFEKKLKDNKGYFNGKISWADFVLVGIIECANYFLQDENIQKAYPNINKLIETVRQSPKIKEYIKTRKPYKLNK